MSENEHWTQDIIPIWTVCDFLNANKLSPGEFSIVNTCDLMEADVIVVYKSEEDNRETR